ncbi:DUF167 domain-containing protein [Salipiger sp. PrR002]|uniref:DUF167 domain-containing protein n=1 Tax=Salipiger sp. PrR002 TaxID=2706489 RepID=UPI0013BE2318|nr:DUF167 domain-containing protein [Salipiger sp. PrR002]NDV98365.1 DUF167 domain-containing protein [Salipiger sp. PrR002]NDW55077.1 DUF167 domain-containing protein [Salipiger sp. PrR004]
MAKPDLTHLAAPGAVLEVRVTPKASRNEIREEDGQIRIYVTTVPENGKANDAVVKLLSKALGVPKSRLTLIRGATSRDKAFRVEG